MASPLSFHCIICIEEFDQRDRYPVVLPCGHTYVCNLCAERLTKCMECREPLLVPDPSVVIPKLDYRASVDAPFDSYRGRAHGTRPQPQRPVPVPKKRLPLPKNVVLMSLMEATDAITTPQTIDENLSLKTVPSNGSYQEDEGQEEKIRMSTWLATSGCGTYVIADKDGVQVYPSIPVGDQCSDDLSDNVDVDAMVRFFYTENTLPLLVRGHEEALIGELPPVRLLSGDRVQVVCIDNGWAKLARGYGYLKVLKGQVAKVGSAVDRACKLEALLRHLTLQRKELRAHQRKLDSQFVAMMQDLQTSLLNDEDLTVIGGDTFREENMKIPSKDFKENESPKLKSVGTDSDNSITELKKVRHPSPPGIIPQSSFGCFSEGFFSDFANLSNTRRPRTSGNCQTEVISDMMRAFTFVDDQSTFEPTRTPNREITQSSTHPSPRTLSEGARAWRERHNRPASSGIDFRTGLSGHLALLSAQASRDNKGYRPNQSMLGRMSSHTGLSFSIRKPVSPRHQKRDDYDDNRTI